METDRRPERGRQLAPLAQLGLAALVAGSMLTFSALAFRNGILDGGSGKVRPAPRSAGQGRAVVLPAPSAEPEVAGRRERRTPDRILVSQLEPGEDVVLGTQIDATDDPKPTPARRDQDRREGHDKAKGKGHQKDKGKGHNEQVGGGRGPDEAKEDGDDWDGNAPDDDDDDDDDDSESSRSGSGRRSRGNSGSKSNPGNSR